VTAILTSRNVNVILISTCSLLYRRGIVGHTQDRDISHSIPRCISFCLFIFFALLHRKLKLHLSLFVIVSYNYRAYAPIDLDELMTS